MATIINAIVKLLGSKLPTVLLNILSVVKSIFDSRKTSNELKIKEKETKQRKELDKKIDDVTKNGNIEDLLNLRKN